MYIKNYNIHNILKLQLRTSNRSLLKGLNYPLSFFETNEIVINPDIILNIGKFTPSNNNCFLIDHKYYIKENYIFCEEFGNKAKWKVEIKGLETSPIIINFDMNINLKYRYIAQDIVPQDLILLPLIEILLGKKGFLLAHAGGIVKEKGAVIFFGRPGSMKTTILMNSLDKGDKILGDDRIIIEMESKKAYTFQLYPAAFEYTANTYKNEYLNFYQKLLVKSKLIKEYVATSEMWQLNSIQIDTLYLLNKKCSKSDKIEITEVSKDTAMNKIIFNNKAEIYGSSVSQIAKKRTFNEYLIAYSFVFPNSNVATYWNKIKYKLEDMLKDIEIYNVEIPYSTPQYTYENIDDKILEHRLSKS